MFTCNKIKSPSTTDSVSLTHESSIIVMFSWSRKLACYAYHACPTGGSHVANKAKLTPQEVMLGMPSFSGVAIFLKIPKLCCQKIHHKKTHPNRASSFIKLKTKKILPSQAHARTWHSNSSFFPSCQTLLHSICNHVVKCKNAMEKLFICVNK